MEYFIELIRKNYSDFKFEDSKYYYYQIQIDVRMTRTKTVALHQDCADDFLLFGGRHIKPIMFNPNSFLHIL